MPETAAQTPPDLPFVHLRMHTEFSVVDGTLRTDDAADAALRRNAAGSRDGHTARVARAHDWRRDALWNGYALDLPPLLGDAGSTTLAPPTPGA
mgnify:CR=1 FL=1